MDHEFIMLLPTMFQDKSEIPCYVNLDLFYLVFHPFRFAFLGGGGGGVRKLGLSIVFAVIHILLHVDYFFWKLALISNGFFCPFLPFAVVNGIHVRTENGNGNGGNGPRGPPMRNNNGYRNESYRGGRGSMRGRGQRPMSGPMRHRDGYHPQQRSFQNNNGRPPTSLKGPSETPVAA